jgi:hypothetical protein
MKLIQKLCEVTGLDPNAGAWAKVITGLDKSQHNGYSLLGDIFVPREQEFVRQEGPCALFLVGTKHYDLKTYSLAWMSTTGLVFPLYWSHDSIHPGGIVRITNANRDWAERLWPVIDDFFHIEPDEPEPKLPSDVPAVRRATLDAVVKLIGGNS